MGHGLGPGEMLLWLRQRQGYKRRRTQLFVAACCRQFWKRLTRGCHGVVEAVERAADGLAGPADVERAVWASQLLRGWVGDRDLGTWLGVQRAWRAIARAKSAGEPLSQAAVRRLAEAATHDANALLARSLPPVEEGWGPWLTALTKAAKRGERGEHRRRQCRMLRCLTGPLPFRPISLDPAWVAWNDGAVRRLAQAVYDERDMPSGVFDPAKVGVLADALEESGCADAELLGHLRGPGVHVRGCYVVDLLLNKT